MMAQWNVLLMMYILLFTSCVKQDNVVEDELIRHFEQFENEASKRGVNIDIESINISGYLEDIEERGTIGQCKSYSDDSQEVIIDASYWGRASNMEKEYVVFHELGHCLLERSHDDKKDANGNCNSIMQSGIGSCKLIYNEEIRVVLLDELFDY